MSAGKTEEERGRRATFDPKSGEVSGSGSSAGGGNPGEDFDTDSKAGSGAEQEGGPRSAGQADERPIDRDENR